MSLPTPPEGAARRESRPITGSDACICLAARRRVSPRPLRSSGSGRGSLQCQWHKRGKDLRPDYITQ